MQSQGHGGFLDLACQENAKSGAWWVVLIEVGVSRNEDGSVGRRKMID